MKLFSILHKETGLTLRQYAKQHKITVFTGDTRVGKETLTLPFDDNDIHYAISERGGPGFYYHWDGICLWWLNCKEWEVRWTGANPRQTH